MRVKGSGLSPRAGKANWLVLAGAVSIVVLVVLLMYRPASAKGTAEKFMYALAVGDAEQLTKLSVMEGVDEATLRKKWDYTVNVAGRYYRFVWTVKSEQIRSDKTAAVDIDLVRNAVEPSAYPEKFPLTLVMRDGQWKVDVRSMPRTMFPGLPR